MVSTVNGDGACLYGPTADTLTAAMNTTGYDYFLEPDAAQRTGVRFARHRRPVRHRAGLPGIVVGSNCLPHKPVAAACLGSREIIRP
ncbi:hypothetical protein ACFY94_04820 [Streptomyces griseorubiginosus]|uniref:hypothetical protein n=1 Tax=Streptomyces griseorubiginosus TaxID=67304 RepID=UPI0036E36FDD